MRSLSVGGYDFPVSTRKCVGCAPNHFCSGISQQPVLTAVQTDALHVWKHAAFRGADLSFKENDATPLIDEDEVGRRCRV